MRLPPKPPLDGLRRQLSGNRDKGRDKGRDRPADGFVRQTFTMPRDAARQKAREWFDHFPKAAYWTEVESWRLLPDDVIEFTMRRLPAAD
jgi:hypothetical protein